MLFHLVVVYFRMHWNTVTFFLKCVPRCTQPQPGRGGQRLLASGLLPQVQEHQQALCAAVTLSRRPSCAHVVTLSREHRPSPGFWPEVTQAVTLRQGPRAGEGQGRRMCWGTARCPGGPWGNADEYPARGCNTCQWAPASEPLRAGPALGTGSHLSITWAGRRGPKPAPQHLLSAERTPWAVQREPVPRRTALVSGSR